MYDFKLSNSLTAEMIEPQQEYRFGYDRHGVKFDLTWTAWSEPHYMKLSKGGEEDPGIKNWVKKEGDFSVGHYEQAGRFTGNGRDRRRDASRSTAARCATAAGARATPTSRTRCAPAGRTCFASAESGWHLYDPQTELVVRGRSDRGHDRDGDHRASTSATGSRRRSSRARAGPSAAATAGC